MLGGYLKTLELLLERTGLSLLASTKFATLKKSSDLIRVKHSFILSSNEMADYVSQRELGLMLELCREGRWRTKFLVKGDRKEVTIVLRESKVSNDSRVLEILNKACDITESVYFAWLSTWLFTRSVRSVTVIAGFDNRFDALRLLSSEAWDNFVRSKTKEQ